MFDFCVIGGGMVGATLAIGLSDLGYTVALVESNKPTDFDKRQPPDLRVSAISLTSEKLLTHLGAWRFIQRMRLCQYKRLSVWDEPRARTDFESAAIGASHLGHIVENRIVQLGLHQVIANKPGITCYWNDAVQAIQNNGQSAVTLASGNIIESRILVGADGGTQWFGKCRILE
ncbi:FAD-dependent monooxygenase [Paraglaciecola aquimarina]|uniref:FAD-dependent monooxygenase n=1 Tax=Paraglaciecola aquimarina TaxID=1235557 RepID=A0ABU3SXY7_9ALTE|nr:FAD-dependent monooxygenase [Paraglaciecola aquimarina]MDU0354861.1 FAD-dependent monooxygenase [Paraglaciecola aquimarina]